MLAINLSDLIYSYNGRNWIADWFHSIHFYLIWKTGSDQRSRTKVIGELLYEPMTIV